LHTTRGADALETDAVLELVDLEDVRGALAESRRVALDCGAP
jgi:hypothetical protein